MNGKKGVHTGAPAERQIYPFRKNNTHYFYAM